MLLHFLKLYWRLPISHRSTVILLMFASEMGFHSVYTEPALVPIVVIV